MTVTFTGESIWTENVTVVTSVIVRVVDDDHHNRYSSCASRVTKSPQPVIERTSSASCTNKLPLLNVSFRECVPVNRHKTCGVLGDARSRQSRYLVMICRFGGLDNRNAIPESRPSSISKFIVPIAVINLTFNTIKKHGLCNSISANTLSPFTARKSSPIPEK